LQELNLLHCISLNSLPDNVGKSVTILTEGDLWSLQVCFRLCIRKV